MSKIPIPLHPLQTKAWGEFRKKTGLEVVRTASNLQLTIHKIPYTPWTIGYLPKGPLPTKGMISELESVGRQENCIFIQIEPNVIRDTKILGYKDIRKNKKKSLNILISQYPNIFLSFHPLFTRYTFQLDLTKSEEELLKNMHPKTRYNIRVAQRHGVIVEEDNSDEAFETYLQLTKETTARQKFYAHNERYHRLMWETLRQAQGKHSSNELTAHLLLAKYKGEVLVAWILFVCDGVLYYPYGASSDKQKEVMASNLMMWEAMRFGKKLGLYTFDMWGALGPHPDKNDPWYGFHRFKEGYGGKLVEFVGSYDFVLRPVLYELYKLIDRTRWFVLRFFRW